LSNTPIIHFCPCPALIVSSSQRLRYSIRHSRSTQTSYPAIEHEKGATPSLIEFALCSTLSPRTKYLGQEATRFGVVGHSINNPPWHEAEILVGGQAYRRNPAWVKSGKTSRPKKARSSAKSKKVSCTPSHPAFFSWMKRSTTCDGLPTICMLPPTAR
jgi:hypothetical protein